MNTVVVWILVMYIGWVKAGGPIVIDNIDSKQNCEAVAQQIKMTYTLDKHDVIHAGKHRCIAVRKVK